MLYLPARSALLCFSSINFDKLHFDINICKLILDFSFADWQRKLREAASEELAERTALQSQAPSGWALCPTETEHPENASNMQPVPSAPDQIVVEAGALRLIVGREYPPEQLAQLLQGLMRSC